MSNETIVLVPANFFMHLDGARITAFPAVGTIATATKTTPEAAVTAGLNKTVVAVIDGSDIHEVVVNLIPGTFSLALFDAARKLTRTAGSTHGLTASYGTLKWVSTSIWVTSMGAQTINADGVEVQPVTLQGLFTAMDVLAFKQPENVTTAQLEAAAQG